MGTKVSRQVQLELLSNQQIHTLRFIRHFKYRGRSKLPDFIVHRKIQVLILGTRCKNDICIMVLFISCICQYRCLYLQICVYLYLYLFSIVLCNNSLLNFQFISHAVSKVKESQCHNLNIINVLKQNMAVHQHIKV